jgi:hypothetical protein
MTSTKSCLQRERETALYECIRKEKKTSRKTKEGRTDSNRTKHTYIYMKKETKRKNGIVDNIRSLKQDMKRRRTEHNANEEARRNVSKSDVLPKKKEKR